MKKSLLIIFGALLILQGGMTYAASSQSTGFWSNLKNAIIKDVTDTAQSTVDSARTRAKNMVKIAQYKQEIKQKKVELAELETSNRNFIYKFFERRRINKEIRALENQIRALEG